MTQNRFHEKEYIFSGQACSEVAHKIVKSARKILSSAHKTPESAHTSRK